MFPGTLRSRILGCLLGLLLSLQLPAWIAAEPSLADGSSLYTFGLHLFRLGDYYRAITELKRFSLLFPQHPQHPAAQVLLGLAFQEEGELDSTIAHFQGLRAAYPDTDVDRIASFKLGEIRFSQHQYQKAATHFHRFLQRFPDGPLTDRTTYLLGLSWALHGNPTQAQQVLRTLPVNTAWSEQAAALRHELQTATLPQPKSPRLAGALAGILPGAGHLYLGKPRHAITVFLLNGLFITGTVYAVLEGLEIAAVILFYFETGWYLGNINSAVGFAHAHNRQQPQAVRDRLVNTYAPAGLTLQQMQLPGIGLRLNF